MAMHDIGSLGHTQKVDLPRDWVNLALYRDVCVGGCQPVLSCEQCFISFQIFISFLCLLLGA